MYGQNESLVNDPSGNKLIGSTPFAWQVIVVVTDDDREEEKEDGDGRWPALGMGRCCDWFSLHPIACVITFAITEKSM